MDARKENLNRFSTSCPSIPGSETLMPADTTNVVNQDTDHHKSLSSLVTASPLTISAQAAMPDGIHREILDTALATDQKLPDKHAACGAMNPPGRGPAPHNPPTPHQEVRIVINDVTLDSSDDFVASPLATVAGDDATGCDLIEQIKRANKRRSSWCPEEGRKKEEKIEKQRMLNVIGRSQSLSSLDGDSDDDEEEDDEDDGSSTASYQNTPADHASPSRYGNHPDDPHYPPTASSTPVTGRTVAMETADRSDPMVAPDCGAMSPASTHPQAYPGNLTPQDTPSPSNDVVSLMFPSTVTKTTAVAPSIHNGKENSTATNISSEAVRMTGQTEDEDPREDWTRGQAGPSAADNTDLSLPSNDEQKEQPKLEKKRKTSVFAKIGSIRQKKPESKLPGHPHQFVSVSFSNATLCDVCNKSMINKASLQCENCMMNVHENFCKDQFSCAKYKNARATNGDSFKDKSSSLPESVNLSVNLKQTQSFKERRSVSVPARPALQVSTSTGALPRSSSPSRVINEERDVKVKDEEVQMQLLDTTNITETLSASLESLDEGNTEVADIEEDFEAEPEAWSVTVDKKTLKKMSAKDIKRQDHIYELIQTERSHCRTLHIMQKIFSRGMREDVGLSQEMVDRIFPRLSDLADIHSTFLSRLRDRQRLRPDRSIEDVSDLLLQQFDGEMGERMKTAYGEFCSSHISAVQLYKDILKADRKFQNFIKKCSRSTICKRLSIPECILLVTQRCTKYPLLIEPIIKTTKDNRAQRDRLTEALALIRGVLEYIDAQVDAKEKYERLLDIYNKLDAKSFAWFRGEKFKKSNLLGHQKLIHEGSMKWMTARGKSFEVLAVILTDVMFFLAENNQKFTFFSQDSKSSVVPLSKLLVREKGDTRDSKGIYLICQSRTEPEMYEFVCRSADERKAWIKVIKRAISVCMEAEGRKNSRSVLEQEGDRKELEAKSARIRQLLDRVYQKDMVIRQSCDEKLSLIMEMLEVFCKEDVSKNVQSLFRDEDGPDVFDAEALNMLKAAMEEGSQMLSTLVPGGVIPSLGRSTTSVGEKGRVAPVLPKRAETFSGFDQREKVIKRYKSGTLAEGDSGSEGQLSGTEGEPPVSREAPAATDTSKEEKATKSGTSFLQTLLKSHTDRDSDSDSSVKNDTHSRARGPSTGGLAAPSREQCESLAQLMQYLHGLVCITGHQVTEIEKFRAQLSEANSKVSTLYSENKRLSHGFHHDQLEILREQQEMIRQERAELEKLKQRENLAMSVEKTELEKLRDELDKQKSELRAQKEEIQHQREVLQRQMDLFEENQRRQRGELPKGLSAALRERSESPTATRGVSPSQRSASQSSLLNHGHRRSASDDLTRQVSPEGGLEAGRDKVRTQSTSQAPQRRESGAHVPLHLLSATNEQKLGPVKQEIPRKLAALSSSGAKPGVPTSPPATATSQAKPSPGVQQMFPLKLSGSQSTSQLASKQTSGLSGASSSPRASGKSSTLDSRGSQHTLSALGRSSSSARMQSQPLAGNILPMKLAEKPRPKSASSALGSNSMALSQSASQTTPPTHSQSAQSPNNTGPEGEIYL